jgi:G3E family GTPase
MAKLTQLGPQTPAPERHLGVKAHSFQFTQPFDLLAFIHWTKVLLMVQGQSIYRIKGIIDAGQDHEKIVFQSVRSQAAFSRAGEWPEGGERVSKIVVIGKNLQREMLEKALKSCLKKG